MQGKRFKWCFLVFVVLVLGILALNYNATTQEPRDPNQGRLKEGASVFLSSPGEVKPMERMMQREIAAGNLRLAKREDPDALGFVHERYNLYYKNVQVWGAQLVRQTKNGVTTCINGEYYSDIDIPVAPAVEKDQAVLLARNAVFGGNFKLGVEPQLVVYPSDKGYLLAYKIGLFNGFDRDWIIFINARTGELILKYNNIQTADQAAIGVGRGIFGDYKKLSTDFTSNKYYLVDLLRPAELITATNNYTQDTSLMYYITDDDNSWTDTTAVDAHGYLGWTYDYYNLFHNWKGIDNGNQQLILSIHLGSNYENAFYSPNTQNIYFGDGNPATNYPYGSALDIVAHEFTHGVTDHTSQLIYQQEYGALNEAFSDIMAVSCEFHFQPEGSGYLLAEWWQGEDIEKSFQAGRDLSNPRSVPLWPGASYFYPDHMANKYNLAVTAEGDWGGVHINSTIPSHWFYLLAHGGTNRTSGRSVSGIGLEDAEKIAFHTWVYHLTPAATFASARSASYQAAVDLFGSSSTQAQRVAHAWDAVGVY